MIALAVTRLVLDPPSKPAEPGERQAEAPTRSSSILSVGWTVTARSLGVLRRHPKLIVFPVVSGVVLFVGGGRAIDALIGAIELRRVPDGLAIPALVLGGLYVGYLTVRLVSTFFNAGLAYCVAQAFSGESPRVRDGMRPPGGPTAGCSRGRSRTR